MKNKAPLFSATIAALLAFFISGCASAPKPDVTQLGPKTYRISIAMGGTGKENKARDIAIMRAAELVLSNGGTHFEILESAGGSNVAAMIHIGNGIMVPATRNNTALTIRICSAGENAMDAAFIVQSIRAKYQL